MRGASDPHGQLPFLETFVHAAEVGSFTACARSLGLTQAAVSQRIQTLERSLGLPLFRRASGQVLLTEAGHRLHAYAQRILALQREARAALTGAETPVPGELTLAASSVPGEHLLPTLLSVFGAEHPHVQVRATVTDSRLVLGQVERGQAHLGLLGMKTDKPSLQFRPFANDEMVLVVPPAHAWAGKRRATLRQLRQQPLILREPGSGSRWCLEQALVQAGMSVQDLHVVLELGSNEAIKQAVRRGMGAAILSRQVIDKELESGRLYPLQVSGLTLTRQIYAVRDLRRALPIPAQLFQAFLEWQHT